MLEGRAEHGEDGVADELVDGPPVLDDDVRHSTEKPVEHVHDRSGVAVLGEAGVPAQVRHEHGDHALLSAEAQPAWRLQERLGDLRGDVAAESGTDEIALAQPFEHAVERAGELADLVARPHGQRLREVPGGDAPYAHGEGTNRPREPTGEEEADDERAESAEPRCPQDGASELLQSVEIDLYRVVDDDHRGGGPHAVEDGGEGGNPRPLRVGIDVRVARDTVLEGPAKR